MIRNNLLAAGSIEVGTASSCLELCRAECSHSAILFENWFRWTRSRVPKISPLAPIWKHLPRQMHLVYYRTHLKCRVKMLLLLCSWSKDSQTLWAGMLQSPSRAAAIDIQQHAAHSDLLLAWSKPQGRKVPLGFMNQQQWPYPWNPGTDTLQVQCWANRH